jgi:hypothetical protein
VEGVGSPRVCLYFFFVKEIVLSSFTSTYITMSVVLLSPLEKEGPSSISANVTEVTK